MEDILRNLSEAMIYLLVDGEVNVLLNASNEHEFQGWCQAFEDAIYGAKGHFTEVDTELTPYEQEIGASFFYYYADWTT